MKKYYLIVLTLALTLFSVLFTSCGTDYVKISNEVRIVKEKKLFRIQKGLDVRGENGWQTVIPAIYDSIEMYGKMFKARLGDSFVIYFRDGTAFNLEGEFTDFTYYEYDKDKYYNNIFAVGEYAMLKSPTQEMGIFLVDRLIGGGYIDCQIFGPFAKFIPGTGGFLFKDQTTGKWGAYASAWRLSSRLIYEHPKFVRHNMAVPTEYDQIIEVRNTNIKDRIVCLWFARNGEQWHAFNADGKEINLDKNLLSRVLEMPVQDRLTKNPWLLSQRVGVEGGSVAFVKCSYNY